MTPSIGVKLKKEQAAAWLAGLAEHLYPGEHVVALTKTNLMQPTCNAVAVTNARIVAFHGRDVARKGVKRELAADHIRQVEDRPRLAGSILNVSTKDGPAVTFGALPTADFDLIRAAAEQLAASGVDPAVAARLAARHEQHRQAAAAWAQVEVIGESPSERAWQLLKDHSMPGESAWFVIGARERDVFAAYDDRCVLVRFGGMTAYSPRAPGERVTTFHYSDIAGIEYHPARFETTVELVTSSHEGEAREERVGFGTPLTRTSAQAFRLSTNTYRDALPRLNDMRQKIVAARRPTRP